MLKMKPGSFQSLPTEHTTHLDWTTARWLRYLIISRFMIFCIEFAVDGFKPFQELYFFPLQHNWNIFKSFKWTVLFIHKTHWKYRELKIHPTAFSTLVYPESLPLLFPKKVTHFHDLRIQCKTDILI